MAWKKGGLALERAVDFNSSARRARSQNDLRTLEMGLTLQGHFVNS